MANLIAMSIRTMGPERYTADQVRVWAMVAFGALTATGHLTALYVHPQHGRRGIGSKILSGLLHHAKQEAIHHVHTEASEFSRGLFSSAGFRIASTETVERDGVPIQRHRMSLSLQEGRTR